MVTGYSVNIFWRNAENPRGTTPFSAHCEIMSQRKRRSQYRLEARFIEKKKVQKLSDAGTPAGSDGGHGAKLPTRCEAAPMTACCVDIQQSYTPQDILCKVKDAETPNGVKTPAIGVKLRLLLVAQISPSNHEHHNLQIIHLQMF